MHSGPLFLACVIDRSVAMRGVQQHVVEGYNTFLAEQQHIPGDVFLSLQLFNQSCSLVQIPLPLRHVRQLDETIYMTHGASAMYDAVGNAIAHVNRCIVRLPENARPEHVVVAVISGGPDNASILHNQQSIADEIWSNRSARNWEFAFLGANQDAPAAASSMAISRGRSCTWDLSREGTLLAFRRLGQMVSALRARARNPQYSWITTRTPLSA